MEKLGMSWEWEMCALYFQKKCVDLTESQIYFQVKENSLMMAALVFSSGIWEVTKGAMILALGKEAGTQYAGIKQYGCYHWNWEECRVVAPQAWSYELEMDEGTSVKGKYVKTKVSWYEYVRELHSKKFENSQFL